MKGAEVERGIHQMAQGELEGARLNLSVEVHRQQLQAPMNRFEARHTLPPKSEVAFGESCPIRQRQRDFFTASTPKLSRPLAVAKRRQVVRLECLVGTHDAHGFIFISMTSGTPLSDMLSGGFGNGNDVKRSAKQRDIGVLGRNSIFFS